MSRQQPETLLVAVIRREIEARHKGCFLIKIHGGPMQVAGIPDLLVFHKGRTYALEVKVQRAGESVEKARARVTAVQRKMIANFRESGIISDCVTSPAEALAVMNGTHVFLDATERVADVVDIQDYRESK